MTKKKRKIHLSLIISGRECAAIVSPADEPSITPAERGEIDAYIEDTYDRVLNAHTLYVRDDTALSVVEESDVQNMPMPAIRFDLERARVLVPERLERLLNSTDSGEDIERTVITSVAESLLGKITLDDTYEIDEIVDITSSDDEDDDEDDEDDEDEDEDEDEDGDDDENEDEDDDEDEDGDDDENEDEDDDEDEDDEDEDEDEDDDED